MARLPDVVRRSADAPPVGHPFEKICYAPGRSILRYAGLRADGPDFALLHGGGWFAGTPQDNDHWLSWLIPRARTVYLIEYGVAALHRSDIEGSFDDVRAAVRWLTATPDVQTHMVLMGFSAGAAMAIDAALTVEAADLAGILLFSPVSDLSADGFRNKMTGEGGRLPLSPLHRLPQHRGQLSCPCLIFHGTNDKTVPVAASRHFAAVWGATQTGPCHLFEVPHCGHGLDKTAVGFARCRAELEAHFFAHLADR